MSLVTTASTTPPRTTRNKEAAAAAVDTCCIQTTMVVNYTIPILQRNKNGEGESLHGMILSFSNEFTNAFDFLIDATFLPVSESALFSETKVASHMCWCWHWQWMGWKMKRCISIITNPPHPHDLSYAKGQREGCDIHGPAGHNGVLAEGTVRI